MTETNAWHWVTGPQGLFLAVWLWLAESSAPRPPLPPPFPVRPHLTSEIFVSCLRSSWRQTHFEIFHLDGFQSSWNPLDTIGFVLPGPGLPSSPGNIFPIPIQGSMTFPATKAQGHPWVILLILISSQFPSSVKSSLKSFFSSFFFYFHC